MKSMRLDRSVERFMDGDEAGEREVIRVEDVSEALLDVPATARGRVPIRRFLGLLRSIRLVKSDEPTGESWTDVMDDEGSVWQVEVPAKVRVKWTGRRASDDDSDDGAMDIITIVAHLMLGDYAILREGGEAPKAGNEFLVRRGSGSVGCLLGKYHVYESVNGGLSAELQKSEINAPVRVLGAVLIVMEQVVGVPRIRLGLSFGGTRYSSNGDVIVESNAATGEDGVIDELELPVVGSKLMLDRLAPIIGIEALKLMCMALFYMLVSDPCGYFIMSDDGGSGKTTILNGYTDLMSSICSTDIDLENLKNGGFDAGQEYASLMGKRIVVADEVQCFDPKLMTPLNSISTGRTVRARWHGGSSSFYCRAWLVLASNQPDRLPNIDAKERRCVTITLQKPSSDPAECSAAWHAKMIGLDGKPMRAGNGRAMSVHDYVKSPQCIVAMIEHGAKLVMDAQKKNGPGFEAVFRGLSMDKSANSENAVSTRSKEALAVADLLMNDPDASKFINGESSNGITGIPTASMRDAVKGMRNSGVFLAKHGILVSASATGDARRTKDGKKYRVVVLTDPEKLKDIISLKVPVPVDDAKANAPQHAGIKASVQRTSPEEVVAPRIPIMPYKDVKEALYSEDNSEVALSRAGSIVGNQLNRYLAAYGKRVAVVCEYASHDITPDDFHPTGRWSKETLTILMDGRPYANFAIQLPGEGDTPHGVDIVTMPGGVVTLANGDGSIHGMNDVAMSIARGEEIGTCAKHDQTFVNSDEE